MVAILKNPRNQVLQQWQRTYKAVRQTCQLPQDFERSALGPVQQQTPTSTVAGRVIIFLKKKHDAVDVEAHRFWKMSAAPGL